MHPIKKRFDVHVSVRYAVFATLYIILSDSLLAIFINDDVTEVASFSIVKGLFFVALTATGLYGVLHAELQKRDRIDQALQEDMRERAKAMVALGQSESRFSTIFHHSPVATGISRLDAHIVDVNDAFLRLSGYERDELIGRTATEVGLWLYPEKHPELVEHRSKETTPNNFEIKGRTKSGEITTLLASAELIDIGGVMHIISMFYNITEQRKLEEHSRYQAMLLAHVSDAVISTDLQFIIRSWNPAAELMYGWKAEEVLGMPIADVVQSEYIGTEREAVIEQFYREGGWRGETNHRRKDGSMVHLLASTSYITDSSGNRTGIVSVNRDITERMQAQEALREAERQRTQIEKERELLQLKERFVSVVSHEFRTPLAVIYTAAEMMHRYYDRMTPERMFGQIREILGQADYMVSLLDDVLLVNKARAGRLEFNPTPLDVVSFCQETLERMQVVDNDKHTLIFEPQGDLPEVSLDSKLLQHILVNLVSNAIKYSPDGGDVRLEIQNRDGTMLFRVRDWGIGIPPDGIAHVYDPFYRATNTSNIKGTGLGLAIVKESVDLHNGTIHCESELGVGTTFTVQLPITASAVN